MATRTQFRCLFSSETVSKVKLSSLFKSPRQIAAVSSPETQLNEFLHENCKLGIINLNEARYFFGYMTHMQPSPPISSFNLLFGAVAKNRHYDAVISFYRKLVSIGLLPDFVTLNILINCFGNKERGLCVENRIKEATWLFKNMIAFGVRPDVITYGTLINGFCRTGNLSVALRLHKKMVSGDDENGLISKPNIFSYSIIIDSLCKEGLVDKAKELFLEMKGQGINPDVVVCTTLIHGFCCAGNWEEVNGLFIEMLDLGPRPNLLTFNVMIDCLCKGGKINEANGLLELMIQRGLNPDRFTYNSLMDGYCLVGRIDTAREIFLSMHSKGQIISNGVRQTVITYNTLLSGLFQAGQAGYAQKLFDEMKLYNVEPDLSTYNILIDGLCKNNCVQEAVELFHMLEMNKFEFGIEIFNCLIDGLCKAGRLDNAWELFHKLPQKGLVPTVVTYSIMIHGLCRKGKLEKANDFLLYMEKNGCAPNVVTFNTLMHGFLQNNKTSKVVELLHKMAEPERNLMPDDTTFSIVVDLLAKDEKYRECSAVSKSSYRACLYGTIFQPSSLGSMIGCTVRLMPQPEMSDTLGDDGDGNAGPIILSACNDFLIINEYGCARNMYKRHASEVIKPIYTKYKGVRVTSSGDVPTRQCNENTYFLLFVQHIHR
ncbi:hypothetical protein CUMW_252190 [Citrus unshiu]|uniref:Uncharacterized protein n=1 Tax=Citrus unshiu TaxID=55188 RepID=A0A2H5QQG2_CITUN|nr:hypothetical protein CUMW_252190 [Citrus unshiu]